MRYTILPILFEVQFGPYKLASSRVAEIQRQFLPQHDSDLMLIDKAVLLLLSRTVIELRHIWRRWRQSPHQRDKEVIFFVVLNIMLLVFRKKQKRNEGISMNKNTYFYIFLYFFYLAATFFVVYFLPKRR